MGGLVVLVGLAIMLIGIVLFYFNEKIAILRNQVGLDDFRIQRLILNIRYLERILKDNGIKPVEYKTVDTEA